MDLSLKENRKSEAQRSRVLEELVSIHEEATTMGDLFFAFALLNQKFFSDLLPTPRILWNSRFKTVAGRFTPSHSIDFPGFSVIEIASYLRTKENGLYWIIDTLGHELIHYWLWIRRKPHGHTPAFYEKMREMGVSRYNLNPVARQYRHVYRCRSCAKDVFTRKRIQKMACASCCSRYNRGYYDARFLLEWVGYYQGSDEAEESKSC